MANRIKIWQCFFRFLVFCATLVTMTSASAAASENDADITSRVQSLIKEYDTIDRNNIAVPLQSQQKMYMKPWAVQKVGLGGTLLFSDSPETVTQEGILYQDTVKGRARLYYYHVNGMSENKKVVAVVQNPNRFPINVAVSRSALAGPSKDYLYVGKTSQENYFGYQQPYDLTIAPQASVILDRRSAFFAVAKDELVCGIYDFYAPQPVKVSVAIMATDADPTEFVKKASVLPVDEHRLRGTFNNMDCKIVGTQTYDADHDKTVYFTLADGNADQYLVGIDATTGKLATNYGNYGVLYYLSIATKGKSNIQYYLQPLGGVYAGAMGVRIDDQPGLAVVPTPAGQLFFGANTNVNEYADLGTYPAKAKVLFEFSPPGASNLPVNIILYPIPVS